MSASFVLPDLVDNQDSWGPVSVPEEYEGLPFLPFGKGDKLNRIADWTSTSGGYPSRHSSKQGDVQSAFSFSGGDDGSFTLVDNQKLQSKYSRSTNKRYTNQSYNNRNVKNWSQNQTNATAPNTKTRQQPRTGKRWRNHAYRYQRYVEKRTYDPSVVVKPEWERVESIDLNALNKVNAPEPQAEDLVCVGELRTFDNTYMNTLARNEKPLHNQEESAFFNKTASSDPVLRNLSDSGNVFASDSVLALLMACTRGVYPWDIVVQRTGNKLFFDKREGSKIDLLTVGENAVEPPPNDADSMNSAPSLSREATLIDQYFSRQVVNDGEKVSMVKNAEKIPSGFSIGNANRGYRYRKFNLADGIDLVARCDVDGVDVDKNGEQKFLTINALNEYDPKTSGIDWRVKLDNQPGAVFANELKANSCKLMKWCARAMLSGTDQIVLGYVSRRVGNPNKHSILKVQQYRPEEFASHIVANPENMWGILKALIQLLLQQPEGKYVLMKEPNEETILLYKVPTSVSV